MFRVFPMILIAVVLYNLTLFGGAAVGHNIVTLLGRNFALPMFSGDKWTVSLGDLFLLLGLGLLLIEIIKATRTTSRAILNHALAILTFCGALAEFLILKGFGTSTFFFITILCLFDVVAGYTISIVAAKRDLSMAPPGNDYS